MKKLLVGALAALMLAGCGGSGGGDAGGDLTADKIELRFTWWGSDARHQRTQQVIDLWQKAHPNITIKGEFKEWNGYWDSLATTMAAQDARMAARAPAGAARRWTPASRRRAVAPAGTPWSIAAP